MLEYDRHAEDVVVTLRFWLEVDSVGGDHKWRGRAKDGNRWRKFDGLDGAMRCLEIILNRVK